MLIRVGLVYRHFAKQLDTTLLYRLSEAETLLSLWKLHSLQGALLVKVSLREHEVDSTPVRSLSGDFFSGASKYAEVIARVYMCVLINLIQPFVYRSFANSVSSVIVLQPPANVEAFVAHTVRISCAAYGEPLPSDISWTGPGGSIATGGRVKIYTHSKTVNATESSVFLVSTLEICGVLTADSGQYTCTASDNGISTSVGSSEASTMLTVVDKAAGKDWTQVTVIIYSSKRQMQVV